MKDHKFGGFIAFITLLCILVSACVITGWAENIRIMKMILPSIQPMKFNTACCLFFSAFSLLFTFRKELIYKLTSRIFVLLVFFISCISLSQDVLHYSAGIDEFIIADPSSELSGTGVPGRMATTTALSFMLVSVALFFIRTGNEKTKEVLQALFHIVTLIALIALTGYLYRVPELYTLSLLSSMPLNTSFFLFIFSIAASLVHNTNGVTGLFTGKRTGNQMARRLLPLNMLALLALGFFCIKAYDLHMVAMEFDIALFAVSSLIITLISVIATASRMNTIDSARVQAQDEINRLNRSLEIKIRERTSQLNHITDNYRLAVSGAQIGICEFDIATDKITGNDIFFRMLGYQIAPPFITALQMHELIYPEDKGLAVKEFQSANTGEKQLDFEHRILGDDHIIRYIKVKGYTEKDAKGNATRILGAYMDVTAQKLAEQHLKQQYDTIKNFVQDAPLQIAMFDTKMCYLAASGAWINDHGLANRDVIGHNQYEIFNEITDERKLLHQRCLQGETIRNEAEKVVRKGHPDKWFSWVMSPWYITGDTIGGMIYCTFDITMQVQQMEALQESEERYSSMVNNVGDYAIYSMDIKGDVMNWNKGGELILGYPQDEITGKQFTLFFTDIDNQRNIPAHLLEQVKTEGSVQYNGWCIRKDKSVFRALISITALHNVHAEITGFSVVTYDLTLREAESEARKYAAILEAKNKEMEQFVYIASHDLREPLRTVSNFIQVIEEDHQTELTEPVTDYINAMKSASLRMNALINGLLEYSRLGRDRRLAAIDCNTLLNNVTDDLSALINETNTLIMAPQLPVINGFESELRQLFQNLIINGIKFRKTGICPEIEITGKELQDSYEFCVRDNGIGIESKYYEKIFFIFQRLHSQEEYDGNGIGLANCKKIVELHGGKIWVDSEPGEGAQFQFTIAKQYI